RVQCYVEILAGELAQSRPDLEVPDVPLLGIASSLHDIGKVGIPDAILLKPGRLTPAERELMESHTLIGGDCLTALRSRMPDDAFLDLACEVAFAHHERWDGKGYPFGLRGEQIPLSARIVTLADVYDALTTKRVYKPAMPHEKAVELISNSAGTQFDPDVVAAFLEREAEFRAVRERLETDAAAFSLANKRIRESEPAPALV
ncbi:MAG: HD domain-containing protein, partial [Planctomycetes bacterium]|nr:HD domain-containing protein [Planctomycetota bacterium]